MTESNGALRISQSNFRPTSAGWVPLRKGDNVYLSRESISQGDPSAYNQTTGAYGRIKLDCFQAPTVAIDLGCMYERIGYWKQSVYYPIVNRNGEHEFLSRVFYNSTKKEYSTNPSSMTGSIRGWKRWIVSPQSELSTDDYFQLSNTQIMNDSLLVKFINGGNSIDINQLLYISLLNLKKMADAQFSIPSTSVVLPLPNHWDLYQRLLVETSARKVGFNDVKLMYSTTAIANFGIINKIVTENIVLIVDIGAGNTNLSIIQVDKKGPKVLAVDGSTAVSGGLFTKVIYDYILTQLDNIQELDLSIKRQLFSDCEDAKMVLSNGSSIDIYLMDECFTIDKLLFDRLCQDTLNCLTNSILSMVKKTPLGHKWIHQILLGGGASQIPPVEKQMKAIFPNAKLSIVPPDAAVRGATHSQNDEKLSEPLHYPVGIRDCNGVFRPIIKANQEILNGELLVTPSNSSLANISIYEGKTLKIIIADDLFPELSQQQYFVNQPRSILQNYIEREQEDNGLMVRLCSVGQEIPKDESSQSNWIEIPNSNNQTVIESPKFHTLSSHCKSLMILQLESHKGLVKAFLDAPKYSESESAFLLSSSNQISGLISSVNDLVKEIDEDFCTNGFNSNDSTQDRRHRNYETKLTSYLTQLDDSHGHGQDQLQRLRKSSIELCISRLAMLEQCRNLFVSKYYPPINHAQAKQHFDDGNGMDEYNSICIDLLNLWDSFESKSILTHLRDEMCAQLNRQELFISGWIAEAPRCKLDIEGDLDQEQSLVFQKLCEIHCEIEEFISSNHELVTQSPVVVNNGRISPEFNKALYIYEDAMVKKLISLDRIDTLGNMELRALRKSIVTLCEFRSNQIDILKSLYLNF
ncbi:Hsp70 protein-domain-containing protein [Globomyces pollinis-pini]|nr:Hsp70 protein-domain-containing protein [Globomyces pollinis-pini]